MLMPKHNWKISSQWFIYFFQIFEIQNSGFKKAYFFIRAAFRVVLSTTANISLLTACIPALFIAIITIINKINSVIAKEFLNKL